MPRMKALAGALLVAVVVGVLGFAPPASAEEKTAACQATYPPVRPIFTFKFTGTVFYTNNGATEHIHTLGFLIHGAHTGGKSDVGFVIRENGAVRVDGHTPDDLGHDEFRTQGVDATVAAASVTATTFRAAFDIAGPDPHCNAHTAW